MSRGWVGIRVTSLSRWRSWVLCRASFCKTNPALALTKFGQWRYVSMGEILFNHFFFFLNWIIMWDWKVNIPSILCIYEAEHTLVTDTQNKKQNTFIISCNKHLTRDTRPRYVLTVAFWFSSISPRTPSPLHIPSSESGHFSLACISCLSLCLLCISTLSKPYVWKANETNSLTPVLLPLLLFLQMGELHSRIYIVSHLNNS